MSQWFCSDDDSGRLHVRINDATINRVPQLFWFSWEMYKTNVIISSCGSFHKIELCFLLQLPSQQLSPCATRPKQHLPQHQQHQSNNYTMSARIVRSLALKPSVPAIQRGFRTTTSLLRHGDHEPIGPKATEKPEAKAPKWVCSSHYHHHQC